VVHNPFLVVGQKVRCIDMDGGHGTDTDTAAQQNLMCPFLFCSVLLFCVEHIVFGMFPILPFLKVSVLYTSELNLVFCDTLIPKEFLILHSYYICM